MIILLCGFFTALTGGSGVTILALGGLLFPMLLNEGYSKSFSLGLLTVSGSIGLLFPPSLPAIIYGVTAGVSVKNVFTAGLLPGLLLITFILNFIWNKLNYSSHLYSFNEAYSNEYVGKVILKTLAFTYLNPHVYSDTIFIIGGFSRELIFNEKIFFVIGASTASFIYFFSLGYASSYFANFINNPRGWRLINIIVIFSMVFLSILITHKILTIIRSIT